MYYLSRGCDAGFSADYAIAIKGYSYTQIIEICGCSRRAVAKAKNVVQAHQLTLDEVAVMTPDRVAQLFPDRRREVTSRFDQPDEYTAC